MLREIVVHVEVHGGVQEGNDGRHCVVFWICLTAFEYFVIRFQCDFAEERCELDGALFMFISSSRIPLFP